LQTQVTELEVTNVNEPVLSYRDSATLRRDDAPGIIEVIEESEDVRAIITTGRYIHHHHRGRDREDEGADEAGVKPQDMPVALATPHHNIPAATAEAKPVHTASSPSIPTDQTIESEAARIYETVPTHHDSLPIQDDAAKRIDNIDESQLDVCADAWHSDSILTAIIRTLTGRTKTQMIPARRLRNRTMCATATRLPAEPPLTPIFPTRCRKADPATRRGENVGGPGYSGSRRRQKLVGKVFGESRRRHAPKSGK
jgi:hypothetical protein